MPTPPLAEKVVTRLPPPEDPPRGKRYRRPTGPARGSKRRKTGGVLQNMRGNRTRAPKWPLLDPAIWDEPKRGKAEWNQEPLSAYAREILAEHLRRKAFWLAIEGGVPTEFAGAAYLPHLKTRRFHEIANEFDELARRGLSAAEAAQAWLTEKAVEGFNSRRIGLGRATCRDAIATLFFTSIAGGQDGFEDLKVRVSWAVDPCQKDSIYRQVLDYTMFSRPRGRPRKDG